MRTFTDDIQAEFNKPNNAVVQLILVNIAVWVLLSVLTLIGHLGADSITEVITRQFILPSTLRELLFRPWSIISFGFTHLGFGHIFYNLLALWFFGRHIQDLIGSNRVLGIYLLSVLLSGFSYLLFGVILDIFPVGTGLLGASGGVYGVVVALSTLSPNYRVRVIFIGLVEIKWIALTFVFLSIIGLTGGNAGGNVAHLGGALMGFIFIKQLNNGNDLGRPVVDFIYAIPNLFKKKSKMKVTYRSSKKAKPSQETPSSNGVSQAEIDRILDKISQSGYPSLTKDEKDKLFKYSNK
jgi:membrane associated rhomboid family serine protease